MIWKKLKNKLRYNRKRSLVLIFFLLLACSLGVGYAFLQTELSIDGTSKFHEATWDVHFNNVQVKSGSVTPTTAATITNPTTVTFAARLENPNDFYEFNVDVVNAGTINAMIDEISILPELTAAQQLYLDYSVTYSDGVELALKQRLDANSTDTLKVHFSYIENIDTSNYPTEDQSFEVTVSITYVQADENAVSRVPGPVFFGSDSWETIIMAVSSNNTSVYHVGDTKTIELGNGLGTHTLRIANNSTPADCSQTGFSQTACGFVLEFVDIITYHRMNPYTSGDTTTIGMNNKGGWEYSDMRAYLNSTTYAYENINYSTTGIYSSLPDVLRNAIIDTTVISGHNNNDSTNFTTTDKLYLLSTHELWEEVGDDIYSGIDYYDTAYHNTRQLDYYAGLNVTVNDYSETIKQRNGIDRWWCLRSAYFGNADYFNIVTSIGLWSGTNSNEDIGVSPAFRLG